MGKPVLPSIATSLSGLLKDNSNCELDGQLWPYFRKRLIEYSNGLINIRFGDIQHGGEADDIAIKAALADEQAIIAGAFE
jgi:hypothetical protein